MAFVVVHTVAYEGSSLYRYENLSEVARHLEGSYDLDDYDVYEIVRSLDPRNVIDEYREQRQAARERALAKLSQEDIEALGL